MHCMAVSLVDGLNPLLPSGPPLLYIYRSNENSRTEIRIHNHIMRFGHLSAIGLMKTVRTCPDTAKSGICSESQLVVKVFFRVTRQ